LAVQEQATSAALIEASSSVAVTAATARASSAEHGGVLRARQALTRFGMPLFIVVAMLCFGALATLRWNPWTGNAKFQATDNAHVTADLTRLSGHIAGEVRSIEGRSLLARLLLGMSVVTKYRHV
jgi:hypothetical protein